MQSIPQLLEQPSCISHCSGANNYTWIHFRNSDRKLLAKSLTYFEERLPSFVRVHKTALINPTCVQTILPPQRAKAPGSITMIDGTNVPVSRRRWAEVIDRLPSAGDISRQPQLVLNTDAEIPAESTVSTGRAPIVLAVTTPDAGAIAHEQVRTTAPYYQLHYLSSGAELASALRLSPPDEWPALILLDARVNRPDRIMALRALKEHPRLRAIPVVWLASPTDDTTQVYGLNANSVITLLNRPNALIQAIEQICRYWLMVAQLPGEEELSMA